MAIVLTVQVQNQVHQVVRFWQEPPDEPFLSFCRKAGTMRVRHVDFIWPYADSMLNFFQLDAWLEDFPRVLEADVFSDAERASAARVLQAASEAREISGYLFFEG